MHRCGERGSFADLMADAFAKAFEPSEIEDKWYAFWREERFNWYTELGVQADKLRVREHDKEELAHYSTATCDIACGFDSLCHSGLVESKSRTTSLCGGIVG